MRLAGKTGLLVLCSMIGVAMSAEARSTSLSSFQWKNRVLVVMAPGRQDESLAAQRRIFQQNASGMAERQIVLIEAADDDDRSRELRRQFSGGDRAFKVVLVGKDGNAAVSSDRPLAANELFGKVDAMPMRRDEMRRKEK
ncbi:DUF4174 domain-containing protein [Rhodopseudomonas sp. P2A-2r]|uniref:DUF4174 domain-containing protein n=1 Tax=unclassified Rhodopseudomonas TaxID=2638247 RepID=UPI0022349AA0|nr:DUF4174 domain-containing protein [Rhodopseudomonas sp. P2A-2r]UZE47543.1 DUF4174 domain-containing protein [Rhodopseudomonas sp. P2A-2r]